MADHYIEVNRTDPVVDHNLRAISFAQSFTELPVFVADMQTTKGGNTAGLRRDLLNTDEVAVKVAEEQSADTEMRHVSESIGYMAVQKMD